MTRSRSWSDICAFRTTETCPSYQRLSASNFKSFCTRQRQEELRARRLLISLLVELQRRGTRRTLNHRFRRISHPLSPRAPLLPMASKRSRLEHTSRRSVSPTLSRLRATQTSSAHSSKPVNTASSSSRTSISKRIAQDNLASNLQPR